MSNGLLSAVQEVFSPVLADYKQSIERTKVRLLEGSKNIHGFMLRYTMRHTLQAFKQKYVHSGILTHALSHARSYVHVPETRSCGRVTRICHLDWSATGVDAHAHNVLYHTQHSLRIPLFHGRMQFVYCTLVGTFPFNSFLSGFICTVGVFVLGGMRTLLKQVARTHTVRAVSLRLQISPDSEVSSTPQRAFAEFAFCILVLFFAVFSFMG
jgi:oligosaccharyltransferase complex subunit epsilon